MRPRACEDEAVTIPANDAPIPPRVRALAGGAALTPVWENGIGAITWRTDDGRHIKYGPVDPESAVAAQTARLGWAARFTTVPRVLAGGGADGFEWLVTQTVAGSSAVAPEWIARPETAVRGIGRGLRAFHDALPVDGCPWTWDVDSRIRGAAERGVIVPEPLRTAPPIDRLVVCHGDACAPNTLLGDDGDPVAHVDLGALGVADRWADIAVAAMSTEWNYGPGYEDLLVRAYGLEPDRERMAYYRDLWNAT